MCTQTQTKTDSTNYILPASMYPQTQTQLIRKRNEWLSERFFAFADAYAYLIW